MKFNTFTVRQTVNENMLKHRAIFEEAMDAYAKVCIATLEKNLAAMKSGKRETILIHEAPPTDHTKDYMRLLSMLTQTSDEDIELSEKQYAQYMLDDWEWRKLFISTSNKYTGKDYE